MSTEQSTDPLDVLLHEESYGELYAAVALLPTKYRRIVELYYGLHDQPEHTLIEVAEIEGLAFKTVAEQLHAAECILKDCIPDGYSITPLSERDPDEC